MSLKERQGSSRWLSKDLLLLLIAMYIINTSFLDSNFTSSSPRCGKRIARLKTEARAFRAGMERVYELPLKSYSTE